jgi:Flp pilus assembly protein TadG
MIRNGRRGTSGSALIEFTFVGIPLIFMLISIFELARGMWIYTTMAHAIKEGTRYAVVHGASFYDACHKAGQPNSTCIMDLQKLAQAINNAGAGLIATDVINVQFTANGTAMACGGTGALDQCLTGGSGVTWDPAPYTNLAIGNTFSISAQYRFQSAISMFWPGAGSGTQFGTFNLPANSQDLIQF